jgi:hypothetical protein
MPADRRLGMIASRQLVMATQFAMESTPSMQAAQEAPVEL